MSAETRRLVFVRHGQTAWNAELRGQGHADIELDEIGHTQAAEVAPRLAGYSPTALWSSDLARARQTAAYVAKETDLDPVYDERLREFDLGDRTGLTMAEFAERYPDEYAAFRDHMFTPVPAGEPVEAVAARFREVLTDVIAELGPGETGLVVSHGAALKLALTVMLGWPIEQSGSIAGLGNCGWVVIDELAYGGRWRLTAYNLTAPDFA